MQHALIPLMPQQTMLSILPFTLVDLFVEQLMIMISQQQISLSQLESISGTIRDQYGQPLYGIWISAWSESQHTGFGDFTQSDGSYSIKDLPKSSDYQISVQPDEALPYIPQERINISSNSQIIDFTLYKGWMLKTKVTDAKSNPIYKAKVELNSSS